MNTTRHPPESPYWKIVVALIGVFGIVIGSFLTYWFGIRTQKAAHDHEIEAKKTIEVRARELERLSFYQQLDIHLDASAAAFKNQSALRNRLVERLEKKYGPSGLEYEPLFEKYYTRMNDEERFLCKQMRGITETLHYHNSEIRGLLTKNPTFYGELSEFKDLYEHLDLWIAKYNRPFKDQENQCLVYVGVAEGKPFPPAVGENVKKRLSELRHSLL